jgi:vacuolar-type H+-ATPase subunit H
MKDRVKGIIAGTAPDNVVPDPKAVHSDPTAPRQALQVLTLAQRTAEEHVAHAHHDADKIKDDARAAAEQIVRDAQANAHTLRREAEKVLSDARAAAEKIAQDAQTHADDTKSNAEKILADARAAADATAADAQENADNLKLQAEQRYEDIVGGLAAKREALQQQIEALEHFDRDYRARLTTFMQGQLRALWVDQPHVTGEIEPDTVAATEALPALGSS